MNSFFPRRYVVQGIFIVITVILLARLFYIQVIDKSYFLSANNNVLRTVTIYPARGVILDRRGKILVQNEPVYDLMVVPREVTPFDTLEFCRLIGISKANFTKKFEKAKSFSPYRGSVLEKQLSAVTFARFQEKLFEFKGFYIQKRSVRRYPDSIAAQFLGYINEVNENDINKSNGFYNPGDYIGRTGVEKSYEEVLRGQRGVQKLMVDAFNRPKGHYAEGKYDTLASTGDNLISSLDKDLQKFGEQLMNNKIGSIVAIEPSTGEILAFVSSPSYDPNLMVGRYKGNNYMRLLNSPNKPLFIRPIQAEYPPGSIFKVINALIGQQSGAINAGSQFFCGGGYRYGRRGLMRCTHVHGSLDLAQSIQYSCNTYYGFVYNRMIDHSGMRSAKAYQKWFDAVARFGVGSKLGIDLPNERKGNLPSVSFYTRHFRSDKWTSSYNISLSIGQGELGITPLQMANVVAAVANRGFFYTPHLIKAFGEKKVIKEEYTRKNSVGVDARYFAPVIEGMSRVVNQPGGTASYSRIYDIEMCGKTGTVQNPHGEDHSVFFAFAPRNNPKIAIAVVVENAGFGATWSAPIASLMVEKYLRDSISRPKAYVERLLKANLLPGAKPKPRAIQRNTGDSTVQKLELQPVETITPKAVLKDE
ncbi:penicillin-binding protein 2 [Arcticibacter tournemirensis]|uniref:Penicillin-binding protein 2 n=1 Tax=Arcticibacter tournemirensis TaxID=699437 RepID=A0A5M9H1K0_9SPHI|nr:penicillin-binding protein 2 [Arcticibacter tournemirensis]KAA8480169.1 penicillin-binding protein 2 [Arcticibacter tournemirensis]TQM52650.1 penicillin-binding protein 2 [Arcticibacter tournemirensis]